MNAPAHAFKQELLTGLREQAAVPRALLHAYRRLQSDFHAGLQHPHVDAQALRTVMAHIPPQALRQADIHLAPTHAAAPSSHANAFALPCPRGFSSMLNISAYWCCWLHERTKLDTYYARHPEISHIFAVPLPQWTAPQAWEQLLEHHSRSELAPLFARAYNAPLLSLDAAADPLRSQARQSWPELLAAIQQSAAQQPLHILLGPARCTEFLAPYSRDLRHPLEQWLQRHAPAELQEQCQQARLRDVHPEDILYAVLPAFIAQHPELRTEREAAERAWGITRHDAAPAWEWINLGHIDPLGTDARLSPVRNRIGGSSWVRLPCPQSPADLVCLEYLLEHCGERIHRISLLCDAQLRPLPANRMALPQHFLDPVSGEQHMLPWPAARSAAKSAHAPQPLAGTILLAYPTALYDQRHLSQLAQQHELSGMASLCNDTLSKFLTLCQHPARPPQCQNNLWLWPQNRTQPPPQQLQDNGLAYAITQLLGAAPIRPSAGPSRPTTPQKPRPPEPQGPMRPHHQHGVRIKV